MGMQNGLLREENSDCSPVPRRACSSAPWSSCRVAPSLAASLFLGAFTAQSCAHGCTLEATSAQVGCNSSEFNLIDTGPEEAGGCEQRSAGALQRINTCANAPQMPRASALSLPM